MNIEREVKMKSLSRLSLFTLSFLSAAVCSASLIDIDQSTAKTSFVAVGKPAMLRIHGESEGVVSKLTIENKLVSGDVNVHLDKFKTGIETRDEHMKKKYLEVEKFPDAILKIKDLSVSDLKAGSKKDLTFKAELTLHGVTKEVEVKSKLEALSDTKYKIQASANIKLSDFKIDIPSYAGIKVADSVDFDVQFQTK